MIPDYLYRPIYYNLLLIITFSTALKIYISTKDRFQRRVNINLQTYILAFFLIIFLGLRPITYEFVDTPNYAFVYSQMHNNLLFDWKSGDALFNGIMYLCAQVMPVEGFFLLIETIYIVCALLALSRFFPQSLWIAFIAFIGNFSFYGGAINGIRIGAATSIFLLGLSYFNKRWIAISLILISIGFHKSMLLPVLALILSLLYKNSKIYMLLWVLSIPVSLFSGGWFEIFFGNLGFDERLGYLTAEVDESLFSHTGFRWDFLLYSSIPIIIGYYVIVKKKITSVYYNLLLNTYIISNAFWILVIRANYSNRFAHLSWFLYSIVLIYPFIHLPAWKDQSNKVAFVLLLQYAFTYFMWLIK